MNWKTGLLNSVIAIATIVGNAPQAFGNNSNDQWIAFGSFRDGDFSGSLHAIKPDGTQEKTLWKREGGRPPVLDPWVAPDGSIALFGRGGANHRTGAWVVDLVKGKEKRLTPAIMTRFGTGAVWASARPNSSMLAIVAEESKIRKVQLHSLDNSEVINLGQGEFPSWSPDGSKLAVFRRQDSSGSVWVLDVSSDRVTKETKVLDNAWYPSWSPDGQSLLLSRVIDKRFDLFTVSLKSGDVRQITQTSDISERTAQWSPDGKLIAYAATSANAARGWQKSIFVLDMETGTAKEITTGKFHDMRPTWFVHQ